MVGVVGAGKVTVSIGCCSARQVTYEANVEEMNDSDGILVADLPFAFLILHFFGRGS